MTKKFGAELKHHALTVISYILSLVAASGLLIAIGNLMGREVITDLSKMAILNTLALLSVLGTDSPPSFTADYASYSIANRPGIAPGFLMGQIVSPLGVGFLDGMVGGYIIGYTALFIRKHLKVPHWTEAPMSTMIILTLSSIIIGLPMYFVIGTPVVWLTKGLINLIIGSDQSPKVLYSFIIDALGCLDFDGSISKAPNLICGEPLLERILEPEVIKVFAAMVPPLGITLSPIVSKFVKKRIYTPTETENIKVALPMGPCMVSEGVIPVVMNDLIRMVIRTFIGRSVTGAVSFTLGTGSVASPGGTSVISATTSPFAALLTLLVGTHVTVILLVLIKKKRTDADEVQVEEAEEEVDPPGVTFS